MTIASFETIEGRPPAVSPEALSYLVEILSRRTPGYVPDARIDPTPPAERSPSRDGRLVDVLLSRAIPAGPAYNSQRLYALDAILHGSPDTVGREIYRRRPKFRESSRTVAKLRVKLQAYAALKPTGSREFPNLELLGHRRGEDDHKPGENGILSEMTGFRPEVKEINRLVNLIVPRGAYFNPVRQAVIKEISKSGEDLDVTMTALRRIVGPWKKELRQQRELGPEEISLIKDIVQAEEPPAKRRRTDDGVALDVRPRPMARAKVPEEIRAAVCRDTPRQGSINEFARTMALRVADSLDALIPPNKPGHLELRVRLARDMASDESWSWANGRKGLGLGTRRDDMEKLERAIKDYCRAWAGHLRELPPFERPSAREESKAKPALRGAKDRARAARAPGQQKLAAWSRPEAPAVTGLEERKEDRNRGRDASSTR